jgi:hypothetical protein
MYDGNTSTEWGFALAWAMDATSTLSPPIYDAIDPRSGSEATIRIVAFAGEKATRTLAIRPNDILEN